MPGAAEDSEAPGAPSPQPELPRRIHRPPAQGTPPQGTPPQGTPAQSSAVQRAPAQGPPLQSARPSTGTTPPGPGPAGPGPVRHPTAWSGSARTATTRTGNAGTGATEAGGTGPGTAGTGSTGTGTGATRAAGRPYGPDRAAIRPAAAHARAATARNAAPRSAAAQAPRPADAAKLPWYEVAHARRAAEGYQNCGPLERVLRREWPPSKIPSAAVVRAINRLAELPLMIKEILSAGVDAIHVGEGGVPELDDMARLRGVLLPSGRATWDACAGAYGEKKIIVGSQPSSAPDVMCHEVGHALDDIDREQGSWQSDSATFRQLYQRCEESLVSDFHKQPGDLGRREFFADAFAAIASRQRPALVDMLGGNIRTALDVMLYFNLRYGL